MFLLKSGKKENLLQLQNEGRIYMNSLSYFENCEDKTRKDELERATFIINNPSKPYYLKIKNLYSNNEYAIVAMITNAVGKDLKDIYFVCIT